MKNSMMIGFFFSSRRRHTRWPRDWSSDVCSSDLLSDAMRFELRGFGIDVILLEPGLITTEFGEAATASMVDTTIAGDDPYAKFNTTVGALTKEIGRASCRERVENTVVDGAWKERR